MPAVQVIRDEIARRGLTLVEVAELAGVAPSTISRILGGVSAPRKGTLLAIAHALDLDLEPLGQAPASPDHVSVKIAIGEHSDAAVTIAKLLPQDRGGLHSLMVDRETTPSVRALRENLDGIQPGLHSYIDRTIDLPLTSHKWDHVCRVENKCLQIVPTSLLEKLTNNELYVLILSIWLHDAGMVPQTVSEPPEETRRRHAVRIADRIRNGQLKFLNVNDPVLRDYVAQVCRNHCEATPELLKADAFFAGGVIRLQLISALLRLSDICEAAYDRIPIDIFEQYNFPESSIKHWKTHPLILGIHAQHGEHASRLRMQAKFSCEADLTLIHEAATSLDGELEILEPVFKKYGWNISPKLERDLVEEKPMGSTTLTVLPSSVYQLLCDHIYGTPDVYIRELVQNAIDACTRRSMLPGLAPEPLIRVTEFFEVVGSEDTPVAIVVSDNGTGMHWRDVVDFLLSVGAGIDRAAEMQLLIQEGADPSKLIATFGIGFLSSISVAKGIIVATKKDGFAGIEVTFPDMSTGRGIENANIEFKIREDTLPLPIGSTFAIILNESGRGIKPREALTKWYRRPQYESYFERLEVDKARSIEDHIRSHFGVQDSPSGTRERLQASREMPPRVEEFSVSVSGNDSIPFTGVLGLSSEGEDTGIAVSQQGIFVESRDDLVPQYARFVTGELNISGRHLTMPASRSQIVPDGVFDQLRRSVSETIVSGIGEYLKKHPLRGGKTWKSQLATSILFFLNKYVDENRDDEAALHKFYDAVAPGIVVEQNLAQDGVVLEDILGQVRRNERKTVYRQIQEDYYFGHLTTSHIDGYDVILLPQLSVEREKALVRAGNVVFTTMEAHKPQAVEQDTLDRKYLRSSFFELYFGLHGIEHRELEPHETASFENLGEATTLNLTVESALKVADVETISTDADIRALFPTSGPGKVNLGHPRIRDLVERVGTAESFPRQAVPLATLLELYFQVVAMRLPQAIKHMEQALESVLRHDEQ